MKHKTLQSIKRDTDKIYKQLGALRDKCIAEFEQTDGVFKETQNKISHNIMDAVESIGVAQDRLQKYIEGETT